MMVSAKSAWPEDYIKTRWEVGVVSALLLDTDLTKETSRVIHIKNVNEYFNFISCKSCGFSESHLAKKVYPVDYIKAELKKCGFNIEATINAYRMIKDHVITFIQHGIDCRCECGPSSFKSVEEFRDFLRGGNDN